MNLKFKEFYFDLEDVLVPLEELTQYEENNAFKRSEYYGHTFCPECMEALLAFHPSALTPYLSATTNHAIKCTLIHDPAPKRILEKYFLDNVNSDDIHRKLRSILSLLILNNAQMELRQLNLDFMNIASENKPVISHKGKTFYIPRKRIDRRLDEEDYDTIKIFYGTFNLEWSRDKFENRILKLKDIKNGKQRCVVQVSEKVYENLLYDLSFRILYFSRCKTGE